MARPGAARTIGARRLRLPRQSFPTRCPLLALSGHFGRTSQCLLLGIKRTWRLRCEMSANDPKRTSSIPIGRCIRLASRVNIVSLLPWMLPAWADFRSTTVVSVCWTIKPNCDDFDAIPRIGRSAQHRNRCSRSLFQATGRLPLWFSQFITT